MDIELYDGMELEAGPHRWYRKLISTSDGAWSVIDRHGFNVTGGSSSVEWVLEQLRGGDYRIPAPAEVVFEVGGVVTYTDNDGVDLASYNIEAIDSETAKYASGSDSIRSLHRAIAKGTATYTPPKCRCCGSDMQVNLPDEATIHCANCFGPDPALARVAADRLAAQVQAGGVDCPETRRAAYAWAVEDAKVEASCPHCNAPGGVCMYCYDRLGFVPGEGNQAKLVRERGPSAVANLPGPHEGATAWASATYESDV